MACLGSRAVKASSARVALTPLADGLTRRSPQPCPKVWRMAKTVDSANANAAARDICSRLYVPLSHFTVHAGGGTLIRHVMPGGSLSARPSRAWNRRSPARVADGMTGLFAAALAQEAGKPTEELLGYAGRHIDRAIMPVAVMGLGGHGGVGQGRTVIARILGHSACERRVRLPVAQGAPQQTPSACAPHTSATTSPECSTRADSTFPQGRSTRSSTTSPTRSPGPCPRPAPGLKRAKRAQNCNVTCCGRCGEPFTARAGARYCSGTCRQAAYRTR